MVVQLLLVGRKVALVAAVHPSQEQAALVRALQNLVEQVVQELQVHLAEVVSRMQVAVVEVSTLQKVVLEPRRVLAVLVAVEAGLLLPLELALLELLIPVVVEVAVIGVEGLVVPVVPVSSLFGMQIHTQQQQALQVAQQSQLQVDI